MNEPASLRHTFKKTERLHHRTLVEGLFSRGKSIYAFPLRMVWRQLSTEELDKAFCNHRPEGIGRLQMLVTIPKKKRRHAVDRVLMRRRVKEAYRLRHSALREELAAANPEGTLSLGFIWLDNKNADFATVEAAMEELLEKLRRKL